MSCLSNPRRFFITIAQCLPRPRLCSYRLARKYTFEKQAVRAGLADAQRVIGSNATEQDKAEARVEVEVFESIQAALAK